MMTPLGTAGGLQERVREVAVEESKVRAVGGEVGTTTFIVNLCVKENSMFTIL